MIKAIAIDDEPLALKVIQSLCDRGNGVVLEKVFTKPGDALKYLNSFPVDLIFCDIQMPAMTGISLAKALPQNTMVIFTTAYSEYAVTSYELNAIDYLLKPITNQRFTQALNKAREYYTYINKIDTAVPKNIFIRANFALVKIPLADIEYIQGLGDYVKIHVIGRKTVVARMTMKDMMDKLPATEFMRVHRSFILPAHKIDAVKSGSVIMGDKEFPIGKTYVETISQQYNKLL